MEFFQDDVFPPTPDLTKPTLSGAEWLQGKNRDPKLVNLQPSGMQALSDAPKIVREKKYKFDPTKPPEKEIDLKEAVLSRLHQNMSVKSAKKEEEGDEVADDEWN
jgi:hypothetical protein